MKIEPIQVAAMIDATIEEDGIAAILRAACEVNFTIDDSLTCNVQRIESTEIDWLYRVTFTLTHGADKDVAEQIIDFVEKIYEHAGLFNFKSVDVHVERYAFKVLI